MIFLHWNIAYLMLLSVLIGAIFNILQDYSKILLLYYHTFLKAIPFDKEAAQLDPISLFSCQCIYRH